MGWLDKKEQRRIRKKYHVDAIYRCDVCRKPIPSGGLIVIDPRKGYHRRPTGVSTYVSREPRWTSCYECDSERRNAVRHKKDHKRREFLRVMDKVMDMIEDKPKNKWTKDKCCLKLDDKYTHSLVLRAIKALRKEHRLKKRHGYYLPTGESK